MSRTGTDLPINELVEVVKAYAELKSNTKVAKRLGLTERSVRHRRAAAADKGITAEAQEGGATAEYARLRLEDRLRHETRARRSAEKFASQNDTIREACFGLASVPILPPSWPPLRAGAHRHGEVACLLISDVHMGEKVSLSQMGGVNSYDVKIGQARMRRLFQTFVSLTTEHWSGPPPVAIYLFLMGDLISGNIHEELMKTNNLLAIPSVRTMSECLIAGFTLVHDAHPNIPIEVVSVPGNHARDTRKPESKEFVVNSYDTLIAWEVESWFRAKGLDHFRFSAPLSGDALVTIFGRTLLVTHGDRIGSRGGTGFVGPAATVARGLQKLQMDYATQGVIIDTILLGHFHSAMELSQGFVNGSVIGPNEFSKSFRMRPEPASQWMLTMHPNHGIARRWKIFVGDPSEGSIYRGRM